MNALSKTVFYDNRHQCYRHIITINAKINGPLKHHIKRITAPKLSPFNVRTPCCPENPCILAITKLDSHELMCIEDIPNLFNFLLTNNYSIDTSITKMMNESPVKFTNPLICFISYQN